MPAKKTTTRKKQTKPVANVKSTNKKTWRIVLVAALILLVGFVFYWTVGGGNKMSAQAKMATYLENKYGKEFVVENYRVEGSGIGVEGDPTADAYPKTEPDLKFLIWDRGKFHLGNHAYSDGYVAALWQNEEKERLANALQQTLGYLPEFSVEIHLIDASPASRQINKDNMLSFAEGVAKYNEDISYTLRVKSNQSQSFLDKTAFANQYLQIAKLVKNNGKDPILDYSITLPNGHQYGLTLASPDFVNVTNGNQLINQFKEWVAK